MAATTIVVSGLFLLRWYDANRTPTTPFTPEPQILSNIPMNGPNASHFYAAAEDAIFPSDAHIYIPEEMAPMTVRNLAARNSVPLALLRQGFQYRYQGGLTHWTKSAPTINTLEPLPDYIPLRTLGRLLVADAQTKAENGYAADAISAYLDTIRLGRDIGSSDRGIMPGMVGVLLDSMGGAGALKNIDHLSALEARTAARRLEAMNSQEIRLADLLKSQERLTASSYEETLTPTYRARYYHELAQFNHDTMSTETYNRLPSENLTVNLDRLKTNSSIFFYSKQGLADNYTAFMNEMVRRESAPYQKAKVISPMPYTLTPTNQILFSKTDNENIGRARGMITQRTTRDRILLTRLALQAYRLEHSNRFPATLNDLTTGPHPYLKGIPTDLYSPDGNAPLRYENGKVYSVGENGTDDHGTGDDDLTSG